MNRRRFLRGLAGLGLVAAGGGSGWYYGTEIEPFNVQIVEQRIPLPGLHAGQSGLRIAQISDLHMGLWISGAHLQRVVALALAQKPDLFFITGDCLTTGGDLNQALRDLENAFNGLAQRLPVYAVLGNHDHGDWTMANELTTLYDKLGIRWLLNEVQPFRRNGGVLNIAGIDSINGGNPKIEKILEVLPEDGPAIIMAHEPDMADFIAPYGKFALQISGHSHGGQVKLPLFGRAVLPPWGQKYPAGLYKVNDMLLYTNRGIGMFHLHLRLNCPPEITVFTLVPG